MPIEPTELVTMSAKGVDRLSVLQRVQERRLSQVKAAAILGMSTRQIRRLTTAFKRLNGVVNERKRQRQIEAALTRTRSPKLESVTAL